MDEIEQCIVCGKDLNYENCSSLCNDSERHLCDDCFHSVQDEARKRIHDMLNGDVPRCRVCEKELTDETWSMSFRKRNYKICRECHNEQSQKWNVENHERFLANQTRRNRKNGHISMHENKECPSYLGISVTEKLIYRYFRDAIRMRYGNPGYDIVCNRGKLIEVKSSCLTKAGRWMFNIGCNNTAEYFVLVAWDNREDLNIMHVWLIPGNVLSHLTQASIRPITLDKWSQYEKDVTKMLACCNAMKEESD